MFAVKLEENVAQGCINCTFSFLQTKLERIMMCKNNCKACLIVGASFCQLTFEIRD